MVLRTLLAILSLGIVIAGCSVNDLDSPTSNPGGTSEGIEASSISETSVRLRWKGATESGVIYGLHWEGINARSDSGTVFQADTTVLVSGLRPGEAYGFSASNYRDGTILTLIPGSTRTVIWATARHYITEASTNPIRLYETGSNVGSGLVIDTIRGGPRNVDLRLSSDADRVQLALYTVREDTSTFKIGPAYAFSSYRTQYAVDSTIFISRATEPVPGLNAWYSFSPIDRLIDPDGNQKAYTLPTLQPDSMGQGFYVRTGRAGSYHYARVFIVNLNGVLLQGNPPNRFVELEISYQPTPNLPYARAAGRGEPTANARAPFQP
ncbi:MAG: Fibronectin type domain protein [Chlorobi bacterium]|nr:Fibronectin type domain protein [Chlorobiota bacterium]